MVGRELARNGVIGKRCSRTLQIEGKEDATLESSPEIPRQSRAVFGQGCAPHYAARQSERYSDEDRVAYLTWLQEEARSRPLAVPSTETNKSLRPKPHFFFAKPCIPSR